MAWEFEERFETGPDGATLTTSNTNFTAVVTGTHVFSSTQVAHGSLSAKFDTSSNHRVEAEGPSAQTQLFARFYMWIGPSYPGSNSDFFRIGDSGMTNVGIQLRMEPDGQIQARSSGATQTVVMGAATTLSQWVRIEVMLVAGTAGTGQMEVRLFNDPESTTPTDTISHATWDGVASIQQVHQRSLLGVTDHYYDEVRYSDADWIGPLASQSNTSLYATGTQTINDVVDEADTTTDLHLSVDDDPDSPNDADWVNNAVSIASGASVFFNLTDLPADFGTADSATIPVRTRGVDVGGTPLKLFAQLFQSDETTSLSDEVECVTESSSSSYANHTATFTGLNTTADKTVWDSARIRFRWGT